MRSPLLNIKKVSYKPIISDLSLQVFPGDFIVILGHNGSGKSSFLNCINGRYSITSGEMNLNEKSLHTMSIEQRAKYISTLSQETHLFKKLTVRENLLVASRHPPLPADLADKLHLQAAQLSGGQRQSLALSMALINDPNILILDEHTSALDPKAAQESMKMVDEISKRNPNLAILMTTHSLDIALQYGNRLLMMKNGSLKEKETLNLSRESILNAY